MDDQTDDVQIRLYFERKPGSDVVTVTAKQGDRVIYVDRISLVKAREREEFANQLVKLAPAVKKDEVLQILLQKAGQQGDEIEERPTKPSRDELLNETQPFALQAAREMLSDPLLIKRIHSDLERVGVAGERELAVSLYLVGTSRLLKKPLASIVQGPSSSGKSYVIEKVASMFPPEATLIATSMTPQALFFMEAGALKHRFVVAGERSRKEDDDTAEATRALREMLSAGKLSKAIPMKVGNIMTTQLVEQEGPIAYVESTTLSSIFDEDLNRMILLNTDERAEQTRKIVSAVAARAASNGNTEDVTILQRHFAVQRLLEPLNVVVPFAEVLGSRFPTDRVETRRAFPHTIALIQAVALLHQYQRKRDDDGNLVASIDDYKISRHLLASPLARQLTGAVSEPAKRFAHKLAEVFEGKHFDSKEARRSSKASKSSAYGWLAELVEAGAVEVVEAGKGPRPTIYKVVNADLADGPAVLPPADALHPAESR